MRRVLALVFFAMLGLAGMLSLAARAPAPRWWKGNTHTHTLNSDGDSSPGEVSHWYRDHGYDFLVLSDHNFYTLTDELQREFDRETQRDGETAKTEKREPRLKKFLLIRLNGVEVFRLVFSWILLLG